MNINSSSNMVKMKCWTKAGHQGVSVDLWLCASSKHRCYKHRVQLWSRAPSAQKHGPPVECNSLMLWWRQASVGTTAWAPFLSISFSCDRTLARSSLKPSWISRDLIPTLLFLWRSKRPWEIEGKHPFSSPVMMTAFYPQAARVSATRWKKFDG